MLRSLGLLFLYVAFLGLSTSAPFVATLGYVWVDTFRPQDVAYIILNQFPVALIMGIAAMGGYLLLDRRLPPRLGLETVLQILMVIWINLTLLWAQVPDAAWEKWDWAFKTLVFTTFVPLVIRSRVQIEAFAQTYVFALAANFVPFGIKTLISGGGYGTNLGLAQGNTGLAEGGLLSTVCLMAVPLAIYLAEYNQLLPRIKLVRLLYWIIASLAVVTAFGTYERSALIGIIVLGISTWVRSKHKVGYGFVVLIVASLLIYTTSTAWNARVSTIGDFQQENSAYTRVLVWRWTLGFVAAHPFGGGFQTSLINHIELPASGDQPATIEFGRAFHSIYFEMLGEQGYPGLALFLLITATAFIKLRLLTKRAIAYPELHWVAGLSSALQSGLAVFMTSGAFVGIAFQPMYWYFIAMSISLNAYMWRVETQKMNSAPEWRGLARRGAYARPVPGVSGPMKAGTNAGHAPAPQS